MKAQLHFDSVYENEDFFIAIKARNWYDVVWRFDRHLRDALKHGNITDEQHEIYTTLRDELHKIMDTESVEFL